MTADPEIAVTGDDKSAGRVHGHRLAQDHAQDYAQSPVQAHDNGLVAVTVTYAEPHVHWSRSVSVAVGATVGDVLLASGFRQAHPGWDIDPAGVGIDGRQVDLSSPVAHGDRVEVYRALSFDPMVSRRRRAAHKARRAVARGPA